MKLFGERVVFFEKAKLSFKAVKKETWRGIIGATIFGSICVACGFFAGHAVGFSHYKSPVYFNYMLRSSYGKEGQVYMYQKIMKLYKGKDEE